MQRALCLLFVVVASVGVGCASGEDVAAPVTIAPDEPDVCPAANEVLVDAKAQLNAGTFDPLRPTIERVLVDGGGLATTLSLLTNVLPQLQPETVQTLVGALGDDDTGEVLSVMAPHLMNVVEYLQGSSPYVPGQHLEPIAAAHRIVVNCRASANIAVIRDLMALEVTRAPQLEAGFVVAERGQGELSWMAAFVDAIDAANQIPRLQTMLEQIEIREDAEVGGEGGGAVVVGQQAFVVLAKLLAANTAAPDFQLAPVRDMLDDIMVPLLEDDPEALAALDTLLDLLGVLVTEQSSTFASVQTFMGCVDRHDADAAIPLMLFDYLTIDELSVAQLMSDLAGSIDGDNAGDLRLAIIAILDVLLSFPDQLSDNSAVLGEFIAPEVAPTLLDVVVSLKDTGFVEDIGEFLDVILACKELP